MTLLLLSLFALVLPPLVHKYVLRLEKSFALLTGFLFFLIAGLVVIHIIPEAWGLGGWWALGAFFLAWLLPTAGEHLLHEYEDKVHLIPIIISVTGLAVHGMMDGIALSYGAEGNINHFDKYGLHYHPLPIAVVLHTYPASIFVYWVLEPKYGQKFAVGVLALLGVTTVIGYLSGSAYLHSLHGTFSMGVFEALAAGSLMHLASHRIKH